jgi:hypothetical protein
VVIVPEEIDFEVNVDKVFRVSEKMLNFLMRRTKNQAEAYAVLLIIKKFFDQHGFKEEEFEPLLVGLEELDGKLE